MPESEDPRILSRERFLWLSGCLPCGDVSSHDLAQRERIATMEAELAEVKPASGELEVWLCPVHRSLDDARKLKPLDNCVACIRAQRDELEADNRRLRSIVDADSTEMERLRGCVLQAERERNTAQDEIRRLREALEILSEDAYVLTTDRTNELYSCLGCLAYADRPSNVQHHSSCRFFVARAALQPAAPQPTCALCGGTGIATHDFRDPTDKTPFACPKCNRRNTAAPQLSGEAGEKPANETKNSLALNSFVEYCRNHPFERFWQALRNWSKWNFILAATTRDGGTLDTFNLEGLDGTRGSAEPTTEKQG